MNTEEQCNAVEEQLVEGPKPIAFTVSTHDIRLLYAVGTSPTAYAQLLLSKLKDEGGPVEGVLALKLAHGQIFKMKTNPMVEESCFTYLWMGEAYVHALNSMGGVQ